MARTNKALHACCCHAHQSSGKCAREHKQPVSQGMQAASVTWTSSCTSYSGQRAVTDCAAAGKALLHCSLQTPSTTTHAAASMPLTLGSVLSPVLDQLLARTL